MAENNAAPQLDLSEQVRIRREKLAGLQAEGKDPFVITKFDVTHHSTEVKENFEELDGKSVKVLKADWDRAYGLYRRNSQN